MIFQAYECIVIEASEKMRINFENRSFRNFIEQNQKIQKGASSFVENDISGLRMHYD